MGGYYHDDVGGYYRDDVGGYYIPVSSFPQSSPLHLRPLPARQQPGPALPALYVSGHVVTHSTFNSQVTFGGLSGSVVRVPSSFGKIGQSAVYSGV